MDNYAKDLAQRLIAEAQQYAKTVPGFTKGAIRVLVVLHVQRAMEEFGFSGPVQFSGYIGDGSSSNVYIDGRWYDCFGFAAKKEAGCWAAIERGLGHKSSDLPDGLKFGGRENDPGSVGWTIRFDATAQHPAGGKGDYATIVVSVSGDTGENDEGAAMTSQKVLEQWCEERNAKEGLGLYVETNPVYYALNSLNSALIAGMYSRPPSES